MPHQHFYVDQNSIDANIVAELYAQAEQALKKIERHLEAVSVPTLNQLRYAGCHLARYLRSDGSNTNKDELLKAANHCKRAIYDVYETGISFFLLNLDKFKDDYKSVVITDVMSDWITDLETIESIRDRASETSRNNPGDHFREFEEMFDQLKAIVKKASIARTELNKQLKAQRRNSAIFWITVLTFLFLIFGFQGIKFKGQSGNVKQGQAEISSPSTSSNPTN
ncbi:MAG: hypothetical protein C4560_05210 [Nitrospiraceae bacterium]|nr:MAG: hypothetical protein C4560_05210 [Nitrospiraceae bacterium]